ncbi:MAG: hypothetical protein ACOCW6_02010 [Spirochaetota bacterium]
MKLSTRNRSIFSQLLILGTVVGTLFWELLMRLFGLESPLTLGPIGFDLSVLAVWLSVNPGSILGAALGYLLFRAA